MGLPPCRAFFPYPGAYDNFAHGSVGLVSYAVGTMAEYENRRSEGSLTDEQAASIRAVDPRSIWRIPDGSYLLVRNGKPGRTQFIGVCEPDGQLILAWDFGDEGA